MTALETLDRRIDERLTGAFGETRDARLYRRMRFIRRFEERRSPSSKRASSTERRMPASARRPTPSGLMEHLREGDHLFSNHRCHGHFLAWTGDAFGLLAEIMGKRTDCARGSAAASTSARRASSPTGSKAASCPRPPGIALARAAPRLRRAERRLHRRRHARRGPRLRDAQPRRAVAAAAPDRARDNGWSQSTPSHLNLAGRHRGPIRPPSDSRSSRSRPPTCSRSTRRPSEASAGVAPGAVRGVLVIHTYRLCHHSKNDDNRPVEEVARRWRVRPARVHGDALGPARSARDRHGGRGGPGGRRRPGQGPP